MNKPKKAKISKKKIAKMDFDVPVEIALEDHMQQMIREGCNNFEWKEFPQKSGPPAFTLFYQLPNREREYVAVTSQNVKEQEALREIFKEYCEYYNRKDVQKDIRKKAKEKK